MIICDFYINRPCFCPRKTDSILFVDAEPILTFPITLESLELIARWNTEIMKNLNGIKLIKFSKGYFPKVLRQQISSGL